MKIFNIQPIKVINYVFNEAHFAGDYTQTSYESSFAYKGKKTESLNTLIITFDIRYNVGKNDDLLLTYKRMVNLTLKVRALMQMYCR